MSFVSSWHVYLQCTQALYIQIFPLEHATHIHRIRLCILQAIPFPLSNQYELRDITICNYTTVT